MGKVFLLRLSYFFQNFAVFLLLNATEPRFQHALPKATCRKTSTNFMWKPKPTSQKQGLPKKQLATMT